MNPRWDRPPVRDPHLAALLFESEQLGRARELRCLTKTELANLIGKTPSSITQFENGTIRPDAQTVGKLAMALGIPIEFLARKSIAPSIQLDNCHFRSLRSVSQYKRKQAVRTGEIVHEVICLLEEEGIEFPKEMVSELKRVVDGPDQIERFAIEVRKKWGLGLGPIRWIISLFETQGIRILPLVDVCKDVDAFSFWYESNPYVMLASKPPSRIHFDVAHELGHLLMHEDVEPGNPQAEEEANHFAAAFLLPMESFIAECPNYWSFPIFKALKNRWYVSIQALVVRAYHLGKLSNASYRRAFTTINQLNIRKNEPDEWKLDNSMLIRGALKQLEGEVSLAQISEKIGLAEKDLQSYLEPTLSK